jgi:apolipoprotein N-acyltransferase
MPGVVAAVAGTLGILAWTLDQATGWRQATLLGWVFAVSWLTGTFWWLFISMHTYAGLAAVLAALAVMGLAAVLALYYAAICGAFVAAGARQSCVESYHFCSALVDGRNGAWYLADRFWLGCQSGYAHVDGPLAGYAPWLGVYGVGALAAWLAWTLATQIRPGVPGRERLSVVVLVLTVLAAPGLYQAWAPPWSSSNGRLGVTLLQGNIPQDEKFEVGTGVPQALRWYGEQLQASTSALVIAPETAIPLLPQQLPAEYWGTIQQRFASGRQAALVGTPLGDERLGYTNSVLGLKPGLAQPWRYDKHHLVPFGEFIPPFFKWFTAMMNIPLGDFNRGALVQPAFEWQGQRLAPHVCYERPCLARNSAPNFMESALAPTIFVNVSNIWLGLAIRVALDQHLQISRMRALEFARPFVHWRPIPA